MVAFQFIPNVGSTDHHPDELHDLSLSADRSTITFERSFASVLAKWTVRPRYMDTPSHSHRPFLSFRDDESVQTTEFPTSETGASPFVTLGSKEVALAQVASAHDLEALSSKKTKELISDRLSAYEDTLRVDVYFQSLSLTELRSMDVSLEDGQSRKYPLVSRSYRLGYASDRGQRIDYRLMSLYFDRSVDGQDLLDAAQRLRLTLVSSGERWKFDWKWNQTSASAPATPADR